MNEIRDGDPEMASRRLELVLDLPVLALGEDVQELVVTWNCKHIANGSVIRRLGEVNHRLNRPTPVIVTPEELQPISEGE